MFLVSPKNNGLHSCVANCAAVGLYYDPINNICVGCHPACENCFGPDNDDCYSCNSGFV